MTGSPAEEDVRRLHWGSGPGRPGWLTVGQGPDPITGAGEDIIRDGLPFGDGTVHCIAAPQAVQALHTHDVVTALRELRRVLIPGGDLRVGVPDFDTMVDAYRRRDTTALWCWQWATVSGNHLTQLTNHGFTRTLFCFEFLEELLHHAGFHRVRRVAYGSTTTQWTDIAAFDARPAESLYVEAERRGGSAPRVEPTPAPRHVHLSWTRDPAASLTVRWSATAPSSVEYRALGADGWMSAEAVSSSAPAVPPQQTAEITGLSPDTSYEYRVVSSSPGESFVARTAPLPGRGFTFAFLCDTGLRGRPDGNADGVGDVIEAVRSSKPVFVLGGGDYAYANGDARYDDVVSAVDAWFTQMQPLIARVPFMAQYGNHEVGLGERLRDWAPRFALPTTGSTAQYSFDVADAHVVALFVPDGPPDGEQLAWLDEDLGAARKRGARWLIAFQHEPLFAHGHSHPAQREVRTRLSPVFERHGLDLHLSGHDQNYERTYPLADAHRTPVVRSSHARSYEAGRGVIYAKVSPGGKRSDVRNDFSHFTTPQQPWIARRDDTLHHYALVHVSPAAVRVEAYGLAGDGTPATLVDAFTIVSRTKDEPEAAGASAATR